MDRRSFLSKAGIGVAGIAASSAILAACSSSDDESTDGSGDSDSDPDSDSDSDSDEVTLTQGEPELEWEMGTSWPTALVTLFGAAQFFTEQVSRLTGGKFKINARPAGEIVGGLEVLPTVRDGGMEVGHTASYYYVGLSPVQQFGTAVPFGLTQRQQNAWLYQGGGLDLLNEFYAEEYGIIAFPAGGTGCQMGGWFTKEINTVADLQGLKMRIPGLAGQVLTNLGGEQITVAGGEILTSIETGAIDAAEFVGPTDDLILGLDQLGSQLFYYHPGWWEPGTAVEVQIPLALWNDLPPEFQAAVENAAAYANINTIATYDVLNQADLQKVKEFADIREFSPELMSAFREETENVLDSVAADDSTFATILESWRTFRDGIEEWHGLAERSYLTQQTA
ncbi:MAG: ABC transporter substrate-binding protein [Actinomycetia bacterium]|nr:ABC transporter substrate-binding protein [Actinomycetes bacterium]MCP5034101.1 ABC transporter substrate-binding protein [Actinomycetes bacterium]